MESSIPPSEHFGRRGRTPFVMIVVQVILRGVDMVPGTGIRDGSVG
jgi:hypothetical protein